MRGRPGLNRPMRCPRSVFSANRALVPLPVLPVRRIGDEIVESSASGVPASLDSVVPKAMLSASRPVGSLMNRSDFETAHVSGLTSCPKR